MSRPEPLVFMLLFVGGFAAFWLLITQLLALVGWRRLAVNYKAGEVPVGLALHLGHAQIGLVNYNNVVKAQVLPRGLGLQVMFLFRPGHPPLLIPWAAIGPFEVRRFLWSTTYQTAIRTAGGGTLRLRVSDKRLPELTRPYL